MTAHKVIVLELGESVDLPEALEMLGRVWPYKGSGTAVHAAIDEPAEAILAFAKGHRSWPPVHEHK
jgi:hypothetical protein